MKYEERLYRSQVNPARFNYFQVQVLETDLLVGISHNADVISAKEYCTSLVGELRNQLNDFISTVPHFENSLEPVQVDTAWPDPVKELCRAAHIAGTGPMAAIAGLFAEYAGRKLKARFGLEEIIVENGGDLYVNVLHEIRVGIFAGKSPLSGKITLLIPPGERGVCTSSGTVGHSLSFGRADAVTIIASSVPVADALATRFGNMVKDEKNIEDALHLSSNFSEILGIAIIVNDKAGFLGEIELC